ncbi:MAG: polymorphic toxin-type HINT domain-containing protein [Planctomycetaceae bacterium]
MLIVAAALMFAGVSATQALTASRAGNRAESRSEAVAARSAVSKSSPGEPILTGLYAAATDRSAVRPATELVAIEQLQVGERVLAESPTGEEDLQFGSDIIPSEWRKLTLRAPKRDGTVADVVLLRPLTWLNQQRGEVGGTVFISVPECGIDGNAEVLEIDPCPEILPGEGRVITGTFRHQVSASISLSIAGQAEPIPCTGNHPFWSEDRHDFVRADSLQPNETLRTAAGTTTVTSFCHIPGSTPVYNLEIHGTHVYHVGTSGVLVHNGDPCPLALHRGASGYEAGLRIAEIEEWLDELPEMKVARDLLEDLGHSSRGIFHPPQSIPHALRNAGEHEMAANLIDAGRVGFERLDDIFRNWPKF